MSTNRWAALAAAMLLAAPAALAQPIKITDARVGLPPGRYAAFTDDSGRKSFVAKTNAWAPVYVHFELVREFGREAAIVIESQDSDGQTTSIAFPLQNLSGSRPGTRFLPVELRFMPYVRVGSFGDVTVRIAEPGTGSTPDRWQNLADPFPIRSIRTREPSRYVVLSLGSELPGFTLPREVESEDGDDMRALRNGRVETARMTQVREMPDQWFGYDAADLVVLSTGSEQFLDGLFGNPDNKPRLDALLEWVRRGGRLVICAGANAALVPQYPMLADLCPALIRRDDPNRQETKLPLSWNLPRGSQTQPALEAKGKAPFPVANVAPRSDRSAWLLSPSDPRAAAGEKPLVLQSPLGLGRVTFVAIDLDRSPFSDSPIRAEFWDILLQTAGAARASVGSTTATTGPRSYSGDAEDAVADNLRGYIDNFEGVPVISFGWVALFILLYTLLIGPIEYYFLKKVLKRLELTWITFPIIVLTVSAVAYFTAYAIKGKDLRLNKLDVVDIDPASQRVYGRMWLTVFSPNVAKYTIGMEPNAGWAAETAVPGAGALVDWYGAARAGRQSIFSNNYAYAIEPPGMATRDPFGDGLERVPVQVWSTKSFTADWSASLAPDSLVQSNLVHPPANPADVSGSFTLNLPVEQLTDVYFIYAGDAYKRDNPIRSGVPETVFLNPRDRDPQWLTAFLSLMPAASAPQRGRTFGTTQQASTTPFASMLFFETHQAGDETQAPQNSTLRRLDQSWRLTSRNRDELIVVARIATARGATEDILGGQRSASPTMLWMNALPGRGTPREPIPGILQQDTFIRIFVPIRSGGTQGNP